MSLPEPDHMDASILRMLAGLASEGIDEELSIQIGKLMDMRPDIQDDYLAATHEDEGGLLVPALAVRYSYTLKTFGFKLAL